MTSLSDLWDITKRVLVCFAQMREVYSHCAQLARDAGQKKKEAIYKKKSLDAAGAISQIYKQIQMEKHLEEEREQAEMEKIMKGFGKLSH